MGKSNPLWSPAILDLLRKLWVEQGRMAKEIAVILAEETGQRVTDKMVISKVHHQKMQGRANPRRRPLTNSIKPVEVITKPMQPPPANEPVDPLVPGGLALVDMERNQCRFPVSPHQATSHRFCGQPARLDGPYCTGHAKIAYRPIERTKPIQNTAKTAVVFSIRPRARHEQL